MNQRDVVKDPDSHLSQVFAGRFREEVVILRAEYVRLADYCRLHNHNIVYVANGGSDKWVQGNDFRGTAKEINAFENKLLWQIVKRLQSG